MKGEGRGDLGGGGDGEGHTLLKMLMSDPRHQPGILVGNTSALGKLTLSGWDYFSIGKVYSSWLGIILH